MKGCLLDCNTLPFAWQKVFCWFGTSTLLAVLVACMREKCKYVLI